MTTAATTDRIATRVEVLEHQHTELRIRMDRGFDDINVKLTGITDALSKHREAPQYGELVKTVAVTVAIVTALFTFLDSRYTMRGESAADEAVLKYRVEQLERVATYATALKTLPSQVARAD